MLTIGQLANQTGVTIRTLRYYDKIGLLLPTDYTEGGHRLYCQKALQRLQQIQSLIFIGFSLKDIADLLENQYMEKRELNHSIAFKKKMLIAEQERISCTIKQLEHMETIIENYNMIDVKLFCFIIHSILFEEENFDEYSHLKGSIHNFQSEARVELDRDYFSLFMDVKTIVANGTNPKSDVALNLVKQLANLTNQTLSKIKTPEKMSTIQYDELNILNPFTEEEQSFLKNAFSYMFKIEES